MDALAVCHGIIKDVHDSYLMGDDEGAHHHEDELMRRALREIANGEMTASQCAAMAELAMSTARLDFARYCS